MLGCSHAGFIHDKCIGIIDDPAILHPDDAVCIVLCQLRVVGDHHHQPVPGHFLQKFHDLHAGLGIQSAGGFVGQQDIRVIDQGTGNGHSLHLTAGHLVGLLMELIAQAHIRQCLGCPSAALGAGDTGNRQCQLHIGQD